MTANHRAAPQLMTLCVLRKYIADHQEGPHITTLSELRNMTTDGVRKHLVYLMRQGYIIRTGKLWSSVWLTEKGIAA